MDDQAAARAPHYADPKVKHAVMQRLGDGADTPFALAFRIGSDMANVLRALWELQDEGLAYIAFPGVQSPASNQVWDKRTIRKGTS